MWRDMQGRAVTLHIRCHRPVGRECSMVAATWHTVPYPCRLHALAYELQLDLAPALAGYEASDSVQPSAVAPAAAVLPLMATPASRDASAFCSAVWAMLGDQIAPLVLFLSECVVIWAMEHLEGLTSDSECKHDPSWPLAFGASYVPSEHVVSSAGAPPGPCYQGCIPSARGMMQQQ
jgi:hypothetical protein